MALVDWIDDSGRPGGNYHPAFAAAYAGLNLDVFAADEEVRAAWDLLEDVDPAGFARVVDFRPGMPDRTIFQVPVAVEGVEASRELIAELEALWGGDASEITVTGGDSLIAAFAVLPPLLVLWALYHRWRTQEFGPASHHPSPPG